MPTLRFVTPTAVLLALCALLAAPAFAGDERPIDVPLVGGKTLNGVVKSSNAKEVVIEIGPEKVRRIPCAALAPPADGDARKRLAELAADLGLYVEARVEYEKALALGSLTKKEFRRAVKGAEIHAVTQGVRLARTQAESGDLEGALETATGLRMHFAGADNAREINRLVNELLELVQRLDREAADLQAELERAMIDVKRNKEILRRKAEALKQLQTGLDQAEKSAEYRARGSGTKARRHAEKADENFLEARRNFGRLRRILPRGSDLRKGVLAKLAELDKAQFELLFEMAWFEWADLKAYTRAERYAARASYIDPVHPELIELRDELVSSRIRYRVSDMTNARGIVR